jgi:riboflavin synthase
MRYIAPKGCVALDGISLTVNEVSENSFGVNIIPHTWDVTTLRGKQVGDRLNIEIDTIARYAIRSIEAVMDRN